MKVCCCSLVITGLWFGQFKSGLKQLCTDKVAFVKAVTGTRSPEGLQLIMTMKDTGENISDLLVSSGMATREDKYVTSSPYTTMSSLVRLSSDVRLMTYYSKIHHFAK